MINEKDEFLQEFSELSSLQSMKMVAGLMKDVIIEDEAIDLITKKKILRLYMYYRYFHTTHTENDLGE